MPGYRYSIEFVPSAGSIRSIDLVKPDFGPALEWCQFEALRSGHLPVSGTAVVEPVFCGGGPGVGDLRSVVPAEGGPFSATLPCSSVFASLAARRRADLAAEKECRWTISALRSDEGVAAERRVAGWAVNAGPSSLASLLRCSSLSLSGKGSNFKAFVHRAVLDETARLAALAAPLECGGVLLGKLFRDGVSGELYLVVTAFVPAPGAEGSQTALRFTPQVWHALRAAAGLRGGNEIWSAWAHSHTPVSWGEACGRCPPEKQRTCELATQLFSEDDRTLHRAVFSRPFCIALVANVLADGVVHSCFGWRLARIERRPIYVLEDSDEDRHE